MVDFVQEELVKEKNYLSNTVRKLNRDVSKVKHFNCEIGKNGAVFVYWGGFVWVWLAAGGVQEDADAFAAGGGRHRSCFFRSGC